MKLSDPKKGLDQVSLLRILRLEKKASTMDFSTRLSLYKFNLDAYEKSRKKLLSLQRYDQACPFVCS